MSGNALPAYALLAVGRAVRGKERTGDLEGQPRRCSPLAAAASSWQRSSESFRALPAGSSHSAGSSDSASAKCRTYRGAPNSVTQWSRCWRPARRWAPAADGSNRGSAGVAFGLGACRFRRSALRFDKHVYNQYLICCFGGRLVIGAAAKENWDAGRIDARNDECLEISTCAEDRAFAGLAVGDRAGPA
jgi:hypothetical protein